MGKSERFQAWFASMVFAAVCLASHRSSPNWDTGDKGKWVLSDLGILVAFSCIGTLAHLFLKKLFVGRLLEGLLSFLLVLFWCAGLPVIMNPDNHIAVTGNFNAPVIWNPNLFFFSWFGFMCSFYIFGNYLQDASGRDLSVDASSKTSKFGFLLAASVVILITASNIHTDADCQDSPQKDSEFCKRNNFAVSLGAVGIFFTLIVMVATYCDKMVVLITRVTALVMLGMTTTGVALITFNEGSGTQLGNLYFATWAAFAVSVFISGQIIRERMGGDDEDAEEEDEEKGEKSRHSEEQEQPVDPTDDVMETGKEAVEEVEEVA